MSRELRQDIPIVPVCKDRRALAYHPDIGRRLTISQVRVALAVLLCPDTSTLEIARRLGISLDAFHTHRSDIVDRLGELHPVSVVLHPGRAAIARIDAVPPCPRCGLRHIEADCYLWTIDDYAMMRTS